MDSQKNEKNTEEKSPMIVVVNDKETNEIKKMTEENGSKISRLNITKPTVSKNNVHFVSFFIIFLIYSVFFSVFILFYNMILTRQIMKNIPSDLYDFLSEFQNISGYDTHKQIIDKIVLKYRIASFFIISLFVLCLNLIIYVYVCSGNQIYYAIRVIIECILLTLLPMYLFCNNSFVINIFENSIGYIMVKKLFRVDNMSFTDFMNGFFIHRDYENIDFTFLFTMFQLNTFGEVLNTWSKNKNANFHFSPDITEEKVQNLMKAVICKNSIGHICWVFFTSIITTFLIYI